MIYALNIIIDVAWLIAAPKCNQRVKRAVNAYRTFFNQFSACIAPCTALNQSGKNNGDKLAIVQKEVVSPLGVAAH